MKREDAERLLHHHYRLHTQVRSTIDNKPPKSMFISPKSTHYKPFANRKPKSLEGTPNPPRRRGQEELAHFLAHKHTSLQIPSSLNSSFNAYARKSMSNLASLTTPSTSAASSRPSTSKTITKSTRPLFDRNSVRAKILDTRTYQPPLHRANNKPPPSSHSMFELSRSLTGIHLTNGGSRSVDSKPAIPQRVNQLRAGSAVLNGRSSSAMRNNMDLYRHKYKEFKEAVLSDILRRGVFTDRIIKDSFYREIERRTDLDLNQMEMIMFDTLTELGVKTSETAPAPPPSRAKRPKTARQRSVVTLENGKIAIPQRTPTVDFADSEMFIPDDKTSQINSLPSQSPSMSSASSSSSGSSSSSSKEALKSQNEEKSDTEASKTDASHPESESESSSSSGSSSSTNNGGSHNSKEEKHPPTKEDSRRPSSLLSESSLDYYKTTTTQGAYRLSSSSELEEQLNLRDNNQISYDSLYNQKHYGREASLDREDLDK